MARRINHRGREHGFSMLELTVVLMVIGIIVAGLGRQARIYAGEQRLATYAEQLKTLGNGANAYASRHLAAITANTPITCAPGNGACAAGRVQNNQEPSIGELQQLGFLPPGFLSCPIFRTPCSPANNFRVIVRMARENPAAQESLQVVAYDPQQMPDVTGSSTALADAQAVVSQLGIFGALVQGGGYVRREGRTINNDTANTVFNSALPPVNSIGYWANYESEAWSAYLRRDGSDTMQGPLRMAGNNIQMAEGTAAGGSIQGANSIAASGNISTQAGNITTSTGGIAAGDSTNLAAGDVRAGRSVTAAADVVAANTVKGDFVRAGKWGVYSEKDMYAEQDIGSGRHVIVKSDIRTVDGGIAAGAGVTVSPGEVKAAAKVEGSELSSTQGRLRMPSQNVYPGQPCAVSDTNIVATNPNQETLVCFNGAWKSTKDLQYTIVDVGIDQHSSRQPKFVADRSWKVCALGGVSAYGGDPTTGKANERVFVYQNDNDKNWYVEIERVIWDNTTRIICFK